MLNLILFATAVSAFWSSTGLHPYWWAAWIAPVPLLWLVRRVPDWRAASLTAFAAGVIGGLSRWRFFTHDLGIPLLIVLLALAIPALIIAMAAMAWRARMESGAAVRAALSFALIWVTYEFASQRLSPHSTAGNLAYSQADFLPLLQIASVAGVAGVSFLVMYTAAALATGRFVPIVSVAICLPVVLLWGFLRMHRAQGGEAVTVGLAGIDRLAQSPEDQRRLFRQYAGLASDLHSQGAKLIVLPEKIARVKEIGTGELDTAFSQSGSELVAGFERWTADSKLNEARVYSASGELLADYEKHHMLPGFEDPLLVGTARTLLLNHVGVEICKDMDFPDLSREYGRDGIGLMLVPAWDFRVDGRYHSRMAIVRGVESGFSIVRAAKQGLLTISDPMGRVSFEMPTSQAGVSGVAEVRNWHIDTLYARWGDWFGFTCVAALVGLLADASRYRQAPGGAEAG